MMFMAGHHRGSNCQPRPKFAKEQPDTSRINEVKAELSGTNKQHFYIHTHSESWSPEAFTNTDIK